MNDKLYENYKSKVIHFIGGIHEYIGQISSKPHPNGEGWLRIENACYYSIQPVPGEAGVVRFYISRIWAMDKLYRKYVDVYCPADSLKEIKELDQNGGLYKAYKKEIDLPDTSMIEVVGADKMPADPRMN